MFREGPSYDVFPASHFFPASHVTTSHLWPPLPCINPSTAVHGLQDALDITQVSWIMTWPTHCAAFSAPSLHSLHLQVIPIKAHLSASDLQLLNLIERLCLHDITKTTVKSDWQLHEMYPYLSFCPKWQYPPHFGYCLLKSECVWICSRMWKLSSISHKIEIKLDGLISK